MPIKERIVEKKARGECLECKNKALPNSVYCARCLIRLRVRRLRWASKKRQKLAEVERERRRMRTASGLCQRCGRPMDPDELERGLVTCPCNPTDRVVIHKNHVY